MKALPSKASQAMQMQSNTKQSKASNAKQSKAKPLLLFLRHGASALIAMSRYASFPDSGKLSVAPLLSHTVFSLMTESKFLSLPGSV